MSRRKFMEGLAHSRTRSLQNATDLFSKMVQDNSARYRPDMADTLNNLATLHRCTRRFDEAEAASRRAFDLYRLLAK